MKRGDSTRNHPVIPVVVILNISYIFPGIPVNWWKNIEKTVLKDMLNFMNLVQKKHPLFMNENGSIGKMPNIEGTKKPKPQH